MCAKLTVEGSRLPEVVLGANESRRLVFVQAVVLGSAARAAAELDADPAALRAAHVAAWQQRQAAGFEVRRATPFHP